MIVTFEVHDDNVPFIEFADDEWVFGTTLTDEQVREIHAGSSAWLKSAGIFPE